MNIFKTAGCAIVLAVTAQTATAVPFAFEARSLGMGNIGVATADIATAPFANPAMLAFQRKDDDFSLLLAVGAYLNDSGGMIDDIDAFNNAYGRFNTATAAADVTGVINATSDMVAIAGQLDNKVIAPEVSGAIAVGFSGETYSMAVSARRDIIATGFMSDVDVTPTGVIDTTKNNLNISGAQTTELGLSLARNFEFMGRKVSVGLTPKIVSVEAISLKESVASTSTGLGDLVDDSVRDLGDFSTLDAGIVVGLTEHIQVGLVAKNLISDEATFLAADGVTNVKLQFDTELRAGLAYRTGFMTLGADLDLIESESIAAIGTKRQMLSLGAELNAFDFAQLRVGMIKNIASGISTEAKKALYSAGVGFWLGFNLDVAVVSGEGDSLGAFVQTGFRF